METEVWKDIQGYEGLYKISSLGNVYSCYTNKILSPGKTGDGYPYVMLHKDKKEKIHMIHRLVAIHFIPNPDNLPIINHKDEDKENYSIDNLEWCTYSHNNTYNGVNKRTAKALSKPVYAYNQDGKCVNYYESVRGAERKTGFVSGNIVSCCNGRLHTYKNLVWSYEELPKDEVISRFKRSYYTRRNKKNNALSKPVNQFDLNGNFISQYPSGQEAGRQLKISSSLIAGVCRGEHRYTHGYIFRYADDINCKENMKINLNKVG